MMKVFFQDQTVLYHTNEGPIAPCEICDVKQWCIKVRNAGFGFRVSSFDVVRDEPCSQYTCRVTSGQHGKASSVAPRYGQRYHVQRATHQPTREVSPVPRSTHRHPLLTATSLFSSAASASAKCAPSRTRQHMDSNSIRHPRFTSSTMLIRELNRLLPYDRNAHSPERFHLSPTPSPSLTDLEHDISHSTHLSAEHRPVSRYRALDALAKGYHVSQAVLQHSLLPTVKHHSVELQGHRVYGARFIGPDGDQFVTTSQSTAIHVYNTSMSEDPRAWTRTHSIRAQNVRWTVTDFAVSPNRRWLAYASITAYIHLVDLHNPTQEHIPIDMHINKRGTLNIWSVMWSHDSRELLVGTGGAHMNRHGAIVIYDVQVKRIVAVVPAHEDDINSICFLQHGDDNLVVSASDDTMVKMWDRREMKYSRRNDLDKPCALFEGHKYGLTHVSSKDDGRFFISNGKDQFIKLWDARKCTSSDQTNKIRPSFFCHFDYRVQPCPRIHTSPNSRDDSVVTYAGSHQTLQTLIRAHFSPLHSTGQKYIYCGSSDGTCAIYNVLTGAEVALLAGHGDAVRDVSWHPYGCFLTTGSWDGEVALWSTHGDPMRSDTDSAW